jgi:hypothetical protein
VMPAGDGEGALRPTHKRNVPRPRPMLFADNTQTTRSRPPG